jgi:hypothetical protein
MQADSVAYAGQFRKAEELTRQAVASAMRADEKETAATYEAQAGLRQALVGNVDSARQHSAAALAMTAGRDVQFLAAITYAFAGDNSKVQLLVNDFAKRYPEDTLAKFIYLPSLHGQQALLRRDSAKAISELQVSAPYESGQPNQGGAVSLAFYPVYIRAEALRTDKQGKEAAAEYQKILDHRGVVVNGPIGALAHLGLGRAYALSGDKAKAKIAYQDFLVLWKDADADVPILKEAKSEYASLH